MATLLDYEEEDPEMRQILQMQLEEIRAAKRHDPACRLPKETYSREKGFTWADKLRSVDCDTKDKEALCVQSVVATMVTQQVLTGESECEFIVRVIDAGGEDDEKLIFGIVDSEPTRFSSLAIGDKRLKPSLGISAWSHGGAVVHKGEAIRETCGIKAGDKLKVKIDKGSRASLYIGSELLHQCRVGGDGKFRCAVSMSSKGQRVRIVDQRTIAATEDSLAVLRQLIRSRGSPEDHQSPLPPLTSIVEVSGGSSGGVDDGAAVLPKERYSPAIGFKWVDTVHGVDCDPRDKVATCVASRIATMVTAQVLSKEDECDFILKVHCVGGEGDEPIMFGVVGEVPNGHSKLPIGHPAMGMSKGACCGKRGSSTVTGSGTIGSFPAVDDGDVLKVRVSKVTARRKEPLPSAAVKDMWLSESLQRTLSKTCTETLL